MQDDRDRDNLVIHNECREWTRAEEPICDACKRPIRGFGQDWVSLEWRAYS